MKRYLTWYNNQCTFCKCIAFIAGVAITDSIMVNYTTVRIYSAHIGLARISAALVNACLVAGTLGIDRALGPTVWRSANVVDGARASRLVADRAALRVWTAR